MRYKTLFRLGLKFLGIILIVYSVPTVFRQAGDFLLTYYAPTNPNTTAFPRATQQWWGGYVYMLEPVLRLIIGLYLLLGGAWIVDLAIPSNRPYCPECGFDLSKHRGAICPECGTHIPREIARQLDERGSTADDGKVRARTPTEEP